MSGGSNAVSRHPDGSLAGIVVLTALVGIAALPALPEQMVVHWSLGTDTYVGVETLPRIVGVLVIPVVTALAGVSLRLLPTAVDDPEAASLPSWWYQALVVGVLGSLFLAQVALVALNLV